MWRSQIISLKPKFLTGEELLEKAVDLLRINRLDWSVIYHCLHMMVISGRQLNIDWSPEFGAGAILVATKLLLDRPPFTTRQMIMKCQNRIVADYEKRIFECYSEHRSILDTSIPFYLYNLLDDRFSTREHNMMIEVIIKNHILVHLKSRSIFSSIMEGDSKAVAVRIFNEHLEMLEISESFGKEVDKNTDKTPPKTPDSETDSDDDEPIDESQSIQTMALDFLPDDLEKDLNDLIFDLPRCGEVSLGGSRLTS